MATVMVNPLQMVHRMVLNEIHQKHAVSTNYTLKLIIIEQINLYLVDVGGHKQLSGCALRMNHIRAMFMKRALTTIRSWPLFVVQLLIPILLLIFAIQSGKKSAIKELPSLPIQLKVYHESVTLVQRDGDTDTYKAATNWLANSGLKSKPVESISKYILKLTADEPGKVRMSYVIAGEFAKNKLVGWFNNDPYHTPPLVLNFIYNSILKSINPEYEITVNNFPLPLSVNSTVSFPFFIMKNTIFNFFFKYYSLDYCNKAIIWVSNLQ